MENIVYFRKTGDRNLSASAHSLLADVLGFPAKLRYGPHGKPYLPDGPEFSLSHTKGLVVCAVSDNPVGVDVEKKRPISRRILLRCLTEKELQEFNVILTSPQTLVGMLAEEETRRFLRIWTCKEAMLKQDGRGLSAGLLQTETTGHMGLCTCMIGEYTLSFCGTPAAFILKER